MRFETRLPDNQKVVVEKNFWTAQTEVRVDNVIIGKTSGNTKEPFRFKGKDGTERYLTLKHEILDPMPQLLVDGKDLFASSRFSPVQTVIICLPAGLALQLGFIPVLVGLGSVYANYFIARNTSLNLPIKWSIIGIVPMLGFLVIAATHLLVSGCTQNHTTHRGPASSHVSPSTYEDPPEWSSRKPTAAQLEAERYTREGK